VKNKARVEESICNANLVEAISRFFSYYFEPHMSTKHTFTARKDKGKVGQNIEETSL
jgi:hypothetical protein